MRCFILSLASSTRRLQRRWLSVTRSGKLVVVPSPIGNLKDITIRAVETLKTCDVILAEDTRKTRTLLDAFDIPAKPVWSHHKFNEHNTIRSLVTRIRDQAQVAALVSDAGTPSISDPGFLLIRACVEERVAVECLPGATACIPALVLSGLPSNRFCFEGFLPVKKGRESRLRALAQEPRTLILYESVHRVVSTLQDLVHHLGPQRPASVSRELTKVYEETLRGSLQELLHIFQTRPNLKGEFVIVVAGNQHEPDTDTQ